MTLPSADELLTGVSKHAHGSVDGLEDPERKVDWRAVGAGLHASIHPCKHAAVMQKLVQAQVDGGKEVKPEAYLVLFLKFISSVCPTIEYDYTVEV